MSNMLGIRVLMLASLNGQGIKFVGWFCRNHKRFISSHIPVFVTTTMSAGESNVSSQSFGTNSMRGSSCNRSGSDLSQILFPLSPSADLFIKIGDITKWSVDGTSDAIVNPANETLLGGGGADGAIHFSAGPELLSACRELPQVKPGIRCPAGEARITAGFRLPSSHVIHTVGPIYGVDPNPKVSLYNAYRNSLKIAEEKKIQYIAFTAISCGVYRYPYEEAAEIALSSVLEFRSQFKEVHFVLFKDDIYNVWVEKARDLINVF